MGLITLSLFVGGWMILMGFVIRITLKREEKRIYEGSNILLKENSENLASERRG